MQINLRKRGSTWTYQFEIGIIDGKRKQYARGGFKTKSEAFRAGTEAFNKFNNTGVVDKNMTVADLLEHWFEDYKLKVKYGTLTTRLSYINTHIKPVFGDYKVSKLNTLIIQKYVNELQIKGLKKIKDIMSTLSLAYNFGIKMNIVSFNPCKNVEYPKEENKSLDLISVDDLQILMSKLNEDYLLPIYIGYYTGMRIAEVFGLEWSDIDFDNNIIYVRKILQERNDEYGVDINAKRDRTKQVRNHMYLTTPKTSKSIRKIKFGENLRNILLSELKKQSCENKIEYYIEKVKDEKGAYIDRITQKETDEIFNPVLRRADGVLFEPRTFRARIYRKSKKLGIKFHFHELRHLHATLLIENNAPIKSVSERLGHSDVQTTMNIYVDNTEEMQKRLVDVFDQSDKLLTNR